MPPGCQSSEASFYVFRVPRMFAGCVVASDGIYAIQYDDMLFAFRSKEC
jgi:hypothetical protein